MNAHDHVPAGLETDIQVAEQVLGWRKLYPPCPACWSVWRPHYERAGLSNCLPRFSQDLNAAMEVWETVFRRRNLCLRRGPHDAEWTWGVFESDPDHFHEPLAFAPTPALAVCRAALQGVRKNA